MRLGTRWIATALLLLVGCRQSPPSGATVIALPDGRPGIGFDDLKLSTTFGVLAPGGRTGNLDLVDPISHAVTAIGGFSMEPLHFAGHDQGATAVDEGGGFFFVTDRTTRRLYVVDVTSNQIGGSAPVATVPDYVRYVPQEQLRVVRKPNLRCVVSGAVVLGFLYLLPLALAIRFAEGELSVPVIGPLIELRRCRDCTANSIEQGMVAGLVLDSVLQAAGASLLILGLVRRKPMQISVAPTPSGFVVGGRF